MYCVKKTKYGKGVFATVDFSPAQPIMKFSGPKISYAQVLRKKNTDNPLQISARRYADIVKPGLYVNHSCEPNCGLLPNLMLVAIKPIKAGDQLSFDYSTTMDEDTRTGFVCKCGAKACRTYIDGFATLPKRKQRFYLEHNVVQRFLRSPR